MSDNMDFQDLEKVYDWVADSIDEVGPEHEALFLSKLCLVLAHNIRDLRVIEEAISVAKADLNA